MIKDVKKYWGQTPDEDGGDIAKYIRGNLRHYVNVKKVPDTIKFLERKKLYTPL